MEFNINNQQQNSLNLFPILDIGVGASCIYPLLGHKMFGWYFYGSDIDQESLEWANNQIISNSLQDSIKLVQVEPSIRLQLILKDLITTGSNINYSDNNSSNNSNSNNSQQQTNNLIQRLFQVFNPYFFSQYFNINIFYI